MLWITAGIIVSYIIGSIPTGYIFGRILKGIDIRKFGSGNIGATNVLRILGKKAGITVLILDILKGFLPVIFIGALIARKNNLISLDLSCILLGLACICGHNWTIFLDFKGGKGIATTLGVLIGLSFKIPGLNIVLLLLVITWIAVFFLTRIVSIASVAAAVFLPVCAVLFSRSKPLVYASILLGLFALVRHLPNIKRFFRGEEPRLNFRKAG